MCDPGQARTFFVAPSGRNKPHNGGVGRLSRSLLVIAVATAAACADDRSGVEEVTAALSVCDEVVPAEPVRRRHPRLRAVPGFRERVDLFQQRRRHEHDLAGRGLGPHAGERRLPVHRAGAPLPALSLECHLLAAARQCRHVVRHPADGRERRRSDHDARSRRSDCVRARGVRRRRRHRSRRGRRRRRCCAGAGDGRRGESGGPAERGAELRHLLPARGRQRRLVGCRGRRRRDGDRWRCRFGRRDRVRRRDGTGGCGSAARPVAGRDGFRADAARGARRLAADAGSTPRAAPRAIRAGTPGATTPGEAIGGCSISGGGARTPSGGGLAVAVRVRLCWRVTLLAAATASAVTSRRCIRAPVGPAASSRHVTRRALSPLPGRGQTASGPSARPGPRWLSREGSVGRVPSWAHETTCASASPACGRIHGMRRVGGRRL